MTSKANLQTPLLTKVIVIAGPTASGKSSLAIELAKKINGYIINADSRQVYKELSIGTAKPIADEIRGDCWIIDDVEHYLYGHISVTEDYTVAHFQREVYDLINRISEEDPTKVPILVGGTGLYIDNAVFNYQLSSEQPSKDSNESSLKDMPLEELQALLGDEINNLNDSDKQNPHRLIRAIERGTEKRKGQPLDHLYLVVDKDRVELEKRIEKRIDVMIKDGLIEENAALRKDEVLMNFKAMQTIGYQEFSGYFEGEKSLEEVKEEILIHTRQYAKRQRTWFKRHPVKYVKTLDEVLDYTSKFLKD